MLQSLFIHSVRSQFGSVPGCTGMVIGICGECWLVLGLLMGMPGFMPMACQPRPASDSAHSAAPAGGSSGPKQAQQWVRCRNNDPWHAQHWLQKAHLCTVPGSTCSPRSCASNPVGRAGAGYWHLLLLLLLLLPLQHDLLLALPHHLHHASHVLLLLLLQKTDCWSAPVACLLCKAGLYKARITNRCPPGCASALMPGLAQAYATMLIMMPITTGDMHVQSMTTAATHHHKTAWA